VKKRKSPKTAAMATAGPRALRLVEGRAKPGRPARPGKASRLLKAVPSAKSPAAARSAPRKKSALKREKAPAQAAISRALVSVYDKEGIVELARELDNLGIAILSTGGTARYLMDGGVPVSRIASYTGFPEMLDGRVKTLHPKIHAGILAVRGNAKHMQDIKRAGIKPIDLVVVNLYPFERTAAMPGVGFDEIMEMIDVGGPTMVRAAAKNFRHVAVLVDPLDYPRAIEEIGRTGSLSEEFRFELAKKAFRHVAAYDTAIFSYLSRLGPDGTLSAEASRSPYPDKLTLEFLKIQDLRYGENPHQSAGFYRELSATGPSIASALKLQGKELSFNNIVDLDAALSLVAEFDTPACAIIKHNNPCGVGLGETAAEAYGKALETDPVSAYGGVIGINVPVDADAAAAIVSQFVEAIVAPTFTAGAQEILAAKKHIRLLEVGALRSFGPTGLDLKRVNGGLLAQDWDRRDAAASDLRVVTKRAPSADEAQAMRFAWTVAKHVRSNAIVYAANDRTLGIGAGQMSRVDSARLGAEKARRSLSGSALASDAFFPFRDGLDEAAARGVTAIIQPGGSIRDEETIAAADEHGMTMVFTGYRHFRH